MKTREISGGNAAPPEIAARKRTRFVHVVVAAHQDPEPRARVIRASSADDRALPVLRDVCCKRAQRAGLEHRVALDEEQVIAGGGARARVEQGNLGGDGFEIRIDGDDAIAAREACIALPQRPGIGDRDHFIAIARKVLSKRGVDGAEAGIATVVKRHDDRDQR